MLDKPITPDQWRPIQQALISVTGADPANKNPSRVMRLPGAYYLGPNGDASGQSRIYASTDRRYTLEEVEAWLAGAAQPAPPRPTRGQSLSPGTLPPRPTDALKQALAKIPPFAHGAGQYDQLVGLAMRLHVDLGAAAAQQLLEETCCGAITDLAAYFKGTPNQIAPGSIWPYLRDQWGIDIRRHDMARNGKGLDNQRSDRTPFDQQPQPQPVEPPPLTLDEVREQFRYAVQGGASRQDLEAERIRLSDASNISASNLRDLFAAIQREEESGVQVAQEAQRLAKAITRADGNAGIRLDQIMPGSPTMIPFEEQVGAEKAAVIAQTLEVAMWQGDTTSGNPNLSRFDGFNKIIAAASPVLANSAPTTFTSITAATIDDILDHQFNLTQFKRIGLSMLLLVIQFLVRSIHKELLD